MSITLRYSPEDKVIELGGGANPQIRPNIDVRPIFNDQGEALVDMVADFEKPLPLDDAEYDGVFSHFVIEHISWRNLSNFLREIWRILKPGGRACLVTANTEAQIEWLKKNPGGWDGKDAFSSMSEIIFGSQDYTDNTHRNYLTPDLITKLLASVGFVNVLARPYGERATDMCIECQRPEGSLPEDKPDPTKDYTREELFDKHYFNGGKKVGGYAQEGYRDFPVHELTAQIILAENPDSVLEIGTGRGYVLKRLQDAGIHAEGLEISRHCYLTRCCNGIQQWDLCNTPWPFEDKQFALCTSTAVLEHIPPEHVERVIAEIDRVSHRGLHGIDFGEKDDGFDLTHTTLKSEPWWKARFPESHKVVNKEAMETGSVPNEYFIGDGKLKVQIGSNIHMFHHGWVNVDALDLRQFAASDNYKFLMHDVLRGLPFGTEDVHLIYTSHTLEHFTYKDGLRLLKECRRVLRPGGLIRIVVPDCQALMDNYLHGSNFIRSNYSEVSDGVEHARTEMQAFYELAMANHYAMYDYETLADMLDQAGFIPLPACFRGSDSVQMLKETTDGFPEISLYVEGRVPVV